MEGDDPQRRQYGHPNYPPGYVPNYRGQNVTDTSGDNLYNPQDMRGGQRGGASQRFRQAHLLGHQGPTSAPLSGSEGHAQDLGGYGFTQQQQYQMQGSSLQFQPDYSQEPQRQQQFPNYTSQLAPNVPQTGQPQSSYDPMPQYQPRQSAAVEVLPNQFSVPQYYNPGEATSASAPAPTAQQYASENFPQQVQYPSAPLERPIAPQPYQQNMTEYAQTGAPVPVQETAQDDPVAKYERYQYDLRTINQDISEGKLEEAAPLLITLSKDLLGNVGSLGTPKFNIGLQVADSQEGLISDKKEEWSAMYEDRLKLWNEFNLLWEALLQRQFENTENVINLKRRPASPQSILDKRALTEMGNELVRLCDSVEQHGLVDYEMGVAEEQIISSESTQHMRLKNENSSINQRC